jgi:hypothetical protein
MKLICAFIILASLISCSHKDIKIAQSKLDTHPVGELSYWSWVKEYNLETKISTRPKDEVVDYLNLWKKVYSLEKKTTYYKSEIDPKNFEHVFRYAVLSFPREYKIRINKHIKSIYLVKDLGISTLAIQLKDFKDSNSSQFIVFMDIDVLNQKINDWYKWREETAFKKSTKLELAPYLSHENSVVDTIHYSLAQLYGIILNWNPKYYPTNNIDLLSNFKNFGFLNESWKLENDIVTSKFDSVPEDMNYLRYYTSDDILFNTEDMLNFYESLDGTNYPNLYAFSSSSKDFVESIATYIHTTVLDKPFSIDINENKKLKGNFGACWQQARCHHKRKEIEKILNLEK